MEHPKVVRNRFDIVESKGLDTGSESKVQQNLQSQTDINQVVGRYKKTGLLQSTRNLSMQPQKGPVFGVYPFEDFQDAYNHIQQVKQDFMALPARVRQRFDNNPSNVVRFVDNPANAVEAIKMGLFKMPEGYEIRGGKLVEQLDIEKEAVKTAPKADDEANPSFKK